MNKFGSGWRQSHTATKMPMTKCETTTTERMLKILSNSDPPMETLINYCRASGYSKPYYRNFQLKSKKFACRIQVGLKFFNTFPDEYDTAALSREAAAAIAVEKLKQHYSEPKLTACSYGDHEIIDKFYNELQKYNSGKYLNTMKEWFEGKFKAALPKHWLSLLKNSGEFGIEESTNGDMMLYAKICADKNQIKKLVLPWHQARWNVRITYCVSTIEIWARLFDEHAQKYYENHLQCIAEHMNANKERALSVSCNTIYLCFFDNTWQRVRIEKVDIQKETVLGFFIDDGPTISLPLNEIYVCDSKFIRFPAQAIRLVLLGLEECATHPNALQALNKQLLHKSFAAQICSNADDWNAKYSVKVVLHDLGSQQVYNENSILSKRIMRETPAPAIRAIGLTKVSITHITDEGDIFMHKLDEDWNFVQKTLAEIAPSVFKREQDYQVKRKDLQRSKIYLIYDDMGANPNKWYRAMLADADSSSSSIQPNDQKINIVYIDYGQEGYIDISKIYSLQSLNTALSQFPGQAIKARLDNIPEIGKNTVKRIRKLLLMSHGKMLIRLGKQGQVPQVILYHWPDHGNGVININDMLQVEHEIQLYGL